MGKHRIKDESGFRWIKFTIVAAVLSLFLSGLAFYLTPFVTYYEIEMAVASRDASKLASYVDLKELRKNLRTQRGQQLVRGLRREEIKDTVPQQSLMDIALQWAALTSDQAIDQSISTEGFYVSLWGPRSERKRPDPIRPLEELSSYDLIKKLISTAVFQYETQSNFLVQVKDDKNRYVGYCTYVLTRKGLNWHLTKIVLPLF